MSLTTTLGQDGFNAPGYKRLHTGTSLDALHLKTFKKAFEGFLELLAQGAPKSYMTFDFYHPAKVASVPIEATAFAQRAPVSLNRCLLIDSQ